MSQAPELNTKRELWLPAIEITETNNAVDVTELLPVVAADTVSIPVGTYYNHKDATLTAAGYPSILQAFEDALNASGALNGTYTLGVGTPLLSTEWTNLGLQISVAGVTSIRFTEPGPAAGRPASLGSAIGLNPGGIIANTTPIDMPFTRGLCWVSPQERTLNLAPPTRIINYSTQYTERDDAYAVDYGSRVVRTFEYEFVHASSIYEGRARNAEYAATGRFAQFDINNAFETVWRSMLRLDDALVVYFDEGVGFNLLVDTHPYEIVRIADVSTAQSFDQIIGSAPTLYGPESYTVTMPVVVKGGTYVL